MFRYNASHAKLPRASEKQCVCYFAELDKDGKGDCCSSKLWKQDIGPAKGKDRFAHTERHHDISDLRRAPIRLKLGRNYLILWNLVCNCGLIIISGQGSLKCDWLRQIRLYSIDPGASHDMFMCACSKAGIHVLIYINGPWVLPTNVLVYYDTWTVDELYMMMHRCIHTCTHVYVYPYTRTWL